MRLSYVPRMPSRLRRTCLTVPASSARMLAKAATLPADEVVVDLEDGVAAAAKEEARGRLAGARALGTLAIRINGLITPWWRDDVEDLPKLQAALDTADANRVIAYDIMTERYEITCIIQRELVNDPDIFGDSCVGSDDKPGVFMESVHYLLKTVAGGVPVL